MGGIQVPVIPPEDNILLKAIWGRGPEQGKHDWEDVEAMMAFVPSLDWEYLRWRSDRLDRPELVQEVMERLEEMARLQQGETEEGPGG
jgi:isochorismate hydrolase